MSHYQAKDRFVIGECCSLHAYHWLPIPPGKPAGISVCGMARERGWTKRTKWGRELRFPAWMAIRHVTCRSCKRVLASYMRRRQ